MGLALSSEPVVTPTPAQRAAVLFVAALAEDVDALRGIDQPNGTPETRAAVAGVVMGRFFGSESDGE